MVAASFTLPEMNARWILYLALSFCVNVLLVQSIRMDLPKEDLIKIPPIKLNLRTFSVAKISAAQPKQSAALPTKAVVKAPVITKNAKKKVLPTVAKPITVPQLERVLQAASQAIHPAPKRSFESLVEMKSLDTFEDKQVKAPNKAHADSTQEIAVPSGGSNLDRKESAALVIHEANYRKQTVPLYPKRAFELGQQGTVMLHAEVMANGLPRQLKVTESSGYRLLDTAAVAAVKQWEFEPTNINGRAIVSWVKVPVNFVIKR